MALLIGIHGIAQQQLGRHQLQAPWRQALADGLERAIGHPTAEPPLDIAYYGDIFLDPPRKNERKAVADPLELLDEISEDELLDLTAAVADAVPHEDLAAAAAESPKGYTRVPLPLQIALRALDRRFGPSEGILYIGELRQVRRYLCCPAIKAAVDARLAAAITPECRILIGHSLGSVIAFEYLRQHTDHRISLLLTVGSPLGLRLVRTRMPDPIADAGQAAPGNASIWVNLRDPRDPITCAGDLRQWWPKVYDVEVNNGSDSHRAERYLSKKQAGEAILSVAPGITQ